MSKRPSPHEAGLAQARPHGLRQLRSASGAIRRGSAMTLMTRAPLSVDSTS
jgi:hypothetical protein